MGRIKIKALNDNDIKIFLPNELSYVISKSKYKYVRATLTNVDGNGMVHSNPRVFKLIISNYRNNYGSPIGYVSFRTITDKHSLLENGLKFSTTIRRNRYDYNAHLTIDKSFLAVEKDGHKYKTVDTHYSDYKLSVCEETSEFFITAYFVMPEKSIKTNINRTALLAEMINTVTPGRSLILSKNESQYDEELYYVHDVNYTTFKIKYLTRDKFGYCVYNNIGLDDDNKHYREMSIAKFYKEYIPEVSEAEVNAFIEYNKMLTEYTPENFQIVSGNDIVKYYNGDTFYKSTGDLGGSCMRYDTKSNVIEFYAKNSNIRMIIFKIKDIDKILGRALLWTTTSGEIVMDRIYAADSKLVSLFHRYADDNGFLNIYKYRISKDPILTRMSPSYWSENYKRNFAVDLEYIPIIDNKDHKDLKWFYEDRHTVNRKLFDLCFTKHTNITSNYLLPYLDNFTRINVITRQASVIALDNFMECNYTKTIMANDDVMFLNDKPYNRQHVVLVGDRPMLRSASRKLFPELYNEEQSLEIVSDVKPTVKTKKVEPGGEELEDVSWDDFASDSSLTAEHLETF